MPQVKNTEGKPSGERLSSRIEELEQMSGYCKKPGGYGMARIATHGPLAIC
jgi:hypothetical protein